MSDLNYACAQAFGILRRTGPQPSCMFNHLAPRREGDKPLQQSHRIRQILKTLGEQLDKDDSPWKLVRLPKHGPYGVYRLVKRYPYGNDGAINR